MNKQVFILQIKTAALVIAGSLTVSLLNATIFGLTRGSLMLLSALSGFFIYATYAAPRMRVLVLLELLDRLKGSDDPEMQNRAKMLQEKLEEEGHVFPKE